MKDFLISSPVDWAMLLFLALLVWYQVERVFTMTGVYDENIA